MGKPVECPQCNLRLWVSEFAVGKITTCPECLHEFVVSSDTQPDDKKKKKKKNPIKESALMDLGDESGFADSIIDDWMNNDDSGDSGDDLGEDKENLGDALALALAEAEAAKAAEAAEAKRKPQAKEAKEPASKEPTPPKPKPKAADPVTKSASSAPKTPVKKPASQSPSKAMAGTAATALQSGDDVNDPYNRIDPGTIRMSLEAANPNSVMLEFPNSLLELLAFRSSIPLCCMGCLEADVDKLIARPLPWIDRFPDKISAKEFADRFARQVPRGISEIEFVNSLHLISQLPMPFGLQMPYYVCRGDCEKDVEVTTRVVATPYGVGCQVHMPTGPCVLDWVARVNGVCGRDYLKLSAMMQQRRSSEWEAMPEKKRQRLATWFDWGGDEQFLIYLSDSDFAKKDEGLAGLVLTDRRLVFRKYKNHGVIQLAKEGTLVFKEGGAFCDLSYETTRNTVVKMVRLRRENAQIFKLLLEGVDSNLSLQDI